MSTHSTNSGTVLGMIYLNTNLDTLLDTIRSWDFGVLQASILVGSGLICYFLIHRIGGRRTTPLQGPSSSNVFFGVMPQLRNAPDSGAVYEEWAAQYGSVFAVPSILGSRRLVFTDPKTIANVYTKETYVYLHTPQSSRFLERVIGRGLFWAEGDSHKRQRRALNPAFSNASIKNLTPIFFDSAYKAKTAWDAMLEGSGTDGTIIEVQKWMNHISLDTIGLAGFSHDFETLSGKTSQIDAAFDSVGSKPSLFDTVVFMLSLVSPIFDKIPTGSGSVFRQLTKTMRSLGDKFLATTGDVTTDKSVIGLLVKSASAEKISHEEVTAQVCKPLRWSSSNLSHLVLSCRDQINVLLLAGYETTSISLTWALIELARNPALQVKLREELLQSDGDLTWEELTNHNSFLDTFTCEILRVHPPLPEIQRIAAEDDVLPLSTPIRTRNGDVVDNVFVRKGTIITLPIQCINRSVEFWGADAKEFNPARWLDESHGADQHRAQEIAGYRHLLTFSDGPRMCLGKVFALMEFKAVLSVLVRNFTFEFPKGPETEIVMHNTNILRRPKVEGEKGYDVPLRIRPFSATE
ncbi:Cytochrome P450 [Mycena venus]|uniref:Cytochrome P450 n=1 Tax=Mycena venus TaxID=2733690 RepID=A0A8H6YKA1_9AGAR|nr:Cytochrome P450 [Mycena venus]